MLGELTEENEILIKNTFCELKLVCDEIVKDPGSNSCSKFITTVDKTPDQAFTYLLEYVSFPLKFHLFKHVSKQHKLPSAVLIDLLKCLKKILHKSHINSISKFIEFCSLLLATVLEFKNQTIIEGILEEIKCEVVECLLSLYENIDPIILHDLYDPLKRNICHVQVVYLCTQLARNEQFLKLRVLSLKCILAVARIGGEQYITIADDKLRYDVGEIVANIFPGIISTCFQIITTSSIIHQNLYIYAIRVFSRMVTMIFENEELIEMDFITKICQLTSKTKVDTSHSNSNSIRTDSWYEMTAAKLLTCTKKLIPVCANLHWKVRLEIVKSADLMLSKCSRKIQKFSSSLVKVLIILSYDDMDQVSEMTQVSLKNLLNQDTRESQQMLEVLEESFCTSLDNIVSSLNSADDTALLSILNLLNGYLNILNLRRVLKSSFHLHRMVTALLKTARFDPSSLNSFQKLRIQELSMSDLGNISTQTISWKNSKHLNHLTEKALKNVCRTISRKVDKQSMTYYLLDILESRVEDRKETIYLINNIILNHPEEYSEEYFNTMKSVLKVYLDPVYMSVPITSNDDDFFESIPLSIIHSNILQVCLLTEGIGNMAECLKQHFKPMLLLCLFSIIENAGNPNEFISSAGLETIKKVTSSCGYSDVSELITDNVDYVTYHVTMKLRNLNQNKKVFDVLDVIIVHCEKESLSALCDIIETLLRSNDILNKKFREGFLKVFQSFVRKLRKWFAPLFNDSMCALNESDETHFKLLLSVNDYLHKNKTRDFLLDQEEKIDRSNISHPQLDLSDLENDLDDANLPDNFNPESLNEESEKETEKPIPQHIKLIVSVTNRLVHVLSTKCTMDKILILEILMDSLLILCDEENQLLPVVHKIWGPLVNRFQYDSKDPLVLRRCFELLCVMAVTARDFIRSRTLKEVLPILNDFISASSAESKLKDTKSVYRMSQKYKIQYIMLRELGYLCIYLWLQEKELDSVLNAVSPYLNSKQPKPLQDACIDLFKTIARFHFEFVCCHLMSMWFPETVLIPPIGTQFNTVKVRGGEADSKSRRNISNLLKLIRNRR